MSGKNIKLKEGDLITVKAESVGSDYERSRDFSAVKVESGDDGNGFSDLRELKKKSIYKVDRQPLHQDLEDYNVAIHHYTIKGQKIESIVFPDDSDDEVLINGEHRIPFESSQMRNLSEAHFLSGDMAQAVATKLNEIELKHLKKLDSAVDKAVVMLGQIVDGKMV